MFRFINELLTFGEFVKLRANDFSKKLTRNCRMN